MMYIADCKTEINALLSAYADSVNAMISNISTYSSLEDYLNDLDIITDKVFNDCTIIGYNILKCLDCPAELTKEHIDEFMNANKACCAQIRNNSINILTGIC
jgi:hypothetical protein